MKKNIRYKFVTVLAAGALATALVKGNEARADEIAHKQSLQEQIEQKISMLKASRTTLDQLSNDQLKLYAAELDRLDKILLQKQKRLERIATELEVEKADYQKYQDELAFIDQQIATYQKAYDDEISRFNNAIPEPNTKATDNENKDFGKLIKSTKSREDQKAKIQELFTELLANNQLNPKQEAIIIELAEKIPDQIEKTDQFLTKKKSQLVEQHEQAVAEGKTITQLKDQVKAKTDKLAELEHQLDQLASVHQDLKMRLTNLKEKIVQDTQEYELAKKDLFNLQEKRDTLKAKLTATDHQTILKEKERRLSQLLELLERFKNLNPSTEQVTKNVHVTGEVVLTLKPRQEKKYKQMQLRIKKNRLQIKNGKHWKNISLKQLNKKQFKTVKINGIALVRKTCSLVDNQGHKTPKSVIRGKQATVLAVKKDQNKIWVQIGRNLWMDAQNTNIK